MVCPICKKTFSPPTAATPDARRVPRPAFCSDRCRTIDLGRWLSADYRIGAPPDEEDLDEGPRGSHAPDDPTSGLH